MELALSEGLKKSPIYQLDDIDKRLVQLLQEDFPLVERPWNEIGSKVGLSEKQVIARIEDLCKVNVIRKIGSVIDSSKVGYTSATLVALRVPENQIDHVASVINQYSNSSHNYERDHEYNVWFTLVAKNPQELTHTIDEIVHKTGLNQVDVLNLPTAQRFKVNVNFRLTDDVR